MIWKARQFLEPFEHFRRLHRVVPNVLSTETVKEYKNGQIDLRLSLGTESVRYEKGENDSRKFAIHEVVLLRPEKQVKNKL
jgi:hypothetical protein